MFKIFMLYKNKRRFIIILCVILIALLYAFKNYSFLIRALSIILSLWLFYFIDHAFGAEFHLRHYIYVISALIFGILLSPLYWVSGIYDKVLHLFMPVLVSIIVFYLVDKLKIPFKWKLLLTLTSTIALIASLEVIEYIADIFWDMKLQGVYLRDISGLEKYDLILDRNDDTMIDIMLGFAGTIIFSISKYVCFFYKTKIKGSKKYKPKKKK